MTTTAPASGYPLQWPPGRPKIAPHQRDRSSFRTTPGAATKQLVREVRLLGGVDLVISTNVPLKKDGTPYAGGYRLDDEAVAVYFNYYGKAVCFACDRWASLGENMHAIGKTIEALRGIARWGTGDMLDAAVSGFAALPAPGAAREWWDVLECRQDASREAIEHQYRRLRSQHHPDKGGDAGRFHEVEQAYRKAAA